MSGERAERPGGEVWGAIRPFLTRFASAYSEDDATARAHLDVLAVEIAEAVEAALGSVPSDDTGDGHALRVPRVEGPKFTDRGFARYPMLVIDTGGAVQVRESSSAEGRFLWLSVFDDDGTEKAAHVDVPTALRLAGQIATLAALRALPSGDGA